jgi:hypothetical protein
MTDERPLPDGIREHIELVRTWLDENVRVYPTPHEITLSEFQIDWDRLTGSFRLAFDGELLMERLRFDLELSGWLRYRTPMFHSPLGAPASYPAVEFTNETRRAIDAGLRATLPRLHGCGIVRATGKEINHWTPIDERVVDRMAFEVAKARASAPGYSISVPVCAAGVSL